jgi:hypothetical protein
VQRLVLIHQRHHPSHQFLAAKIGKLAKLLLASEVRLVEGIASGSAQRAFLGDFDGKRRPAPGKNATPCLEYFGSLHRCLMRSSAAYKTGDEQ